MADTFNTIDLDALTHVSGGNRLGRIAGGLMGLLGWGDEGVPEINRPQPNPPAISRTMDPPKPTGPSFTTGGGGGRGGGGGGGLVNPKLGGRDPLGMGKMLNM